MVLKKVIRKLIFKEKESSSSYIKYLRKMGMSIGENVVIYAPTKTTIDETNAFLISIGNNVKITEGCTILSHDYAWSVFKNINGAILGAQSPVTIGNNVYIGMNTTILRGVTIGDNCVIGAGSVVTHSLKGNGIYAGNPARYISSIDDYFQKRKTLQVKEAKTIVQKYYSVHKTTPSKELLSEYFGLFEDYDTAISNDIFRKQIQLNGTENLTKQYMGNETKPYETYESFISDCLSTGCGE